jgi:magnesium-transporting ATPase (P-type)
MDTCIQPGDADIYGIGVRLSTYFQLASLVILAPFQSDEIYTASLSALPISLAVLVALFRNAMSDAPYVPDLMNGSVMLSIMVFSMLVGLWHKRFLASRALVTLVLMFLLTVLVYSYWWFISGYNIQSECGYMFYWFGMAVAVTGWYRIVGLVLTGLATIGWSVLVVVFTRRSNEFNKLEHNSPKEFEHAPTFVYFGQHPSKRNDTFQNLRFSLLIWVGIVVCIPLMELAVHFSRVEGVNSLNTNGQLIPLFIGSAMLARAVYVASVRLRSRLSKQ